MTPTDAVRSALAGGWVDTQAVLDLAGPHVSDAQAAAANARLERAGRPPLAGAAALDRGRRKVVTDALNSLIYHRHAQGCGGLYRLKTGGGDVGGDRPKGTLETLPLDRLTFDARLQRRAYPAGQLVSPEAVREYAEAMRDGAEFPPLEAVFDGKKHWVIGGFNRGQAAKDAELHSVRVVVYPGTFDDARLWSLSQNSAHGQPRKAADVRKAFDALFDEPKLLARVMAGVKDDGGVYRTLAKAIGSGPSVIQKYLADRGLKATRSGKLEQIARPKPSPPPPPPPPPAAADPDASPARASDPDPEPEPEYVPTPEPDLPGVPAAVRSAIARRPQQDALMKAVAAVAREFAAAAVGPGGEYLRDVHIGGVRLVQEVRRKGRGTVGTDWECPLLLALARAVGSARVQPRACAGCRGAGCTFCADHGHLPESLDYLTDLAAAAREVVAKAAG